MPYSPKIREEELKNKVAADFFAKYDCAEIIAAGGSKKSCANPHVVTPHLFCIFSSR